MKLKTKIVLCCAMTLIIALGCAFYVITNIQERMLIEQVENEARAIFRQVVITRQWIADHGGIFVEQKGDMRPNPYLEESEIIDIQGRKYLRSSPAMVTKEISKYAKGKERYWFHITSLKLTNPENRPDDFETKALMDFEKNLTKEYIRIEQLDSVKYLRYMSPLYVERSCLNCHKKQGYKVGDVRGAISVMIPLEKTITAINQNKKNMYIAAFFTTFTLIIALYIIIQRMVLNPINKLKRSISDFSEGRYQGLDAIRTGDEFEELYKVFSDMALKISGYHRELEDKVREATNELAETNNKLRDLNQRLNELNTRKSDFIARASHELRTPLTTIKGAMDYIVTSLSRLSNSQSQERSIAELTAFCEIIRRNSERLIRMVSNMLDLERIEQGVFEGNFVYSNIVKLIKETVEYLRPEADDKSIIFSISLAKEINVYIDEDRIRQVLINILSNAIKYSPEGGEITIKSAFTEEGVEISITDEGKGIDDDEKDKVFEKFYKGKANKDGSGLGLTICKSIVELHRGKICCRDRGDAKGGVCVYFILPLDPTYNLLQ